jgi:hypothetical protein
VDPPLALVPPEPPALVPMPVVPPEPAEPPLPRVEEPPLPPVPDPEDPPDEQPSPLAIKSANTPPMRTVVQSPIDRARNLRMTVLLGKWALASWLQTSICVRRYKLASKDMLEEFALRWLRCSK